MSLDEFEMAVAHHRAGRLKLAEVAYRKILAREPDHANAIHGLGTIALQAGQPEQAVRLISQAISIRPASMAFHSNLGMAHQALKQYVLAETAFHRASELAPNIAGIYFNLGNCLKEQSKLVEAVSCYQKVIQLQADHATAYNNLGNCYRELSRFDAACQSLFRAIQLRPDLAEAYLNLGSALTTIGQPVEAESLCREAIRLQPQSAAAYVNLGGALLSQERKEDAGEAFRRATELAPSLPEAHENLGLTLIQLGRLADGLTSYRRAVEIAPNRAESWRHLGSGLTTQLQLTEGDACFQRALDLKPDDSSLMSQWLFLQLYRPEVSLRSIAARHSQWNVRFGNLSPPFRLDLPPDSKTNPESVHFVPLTTANAAVPGPGSKETTNSDGKDLPRQRCTLRLGFLSGDFGQHPVGMFSIRTLESLPELGFDIVCYSTHPRSGAINARFKKVAAVWREVQHRSDDDLAALIATDRIDVLIDLAGHSAGSRLEVFTRRPAPVQATWIGNEGTTGLTSIDYLIADERVVPRSADPFFIEKVVRLPVSYVSWDPPANAPAVSLSPTHAAQPKTFCSFNNPAKYHAGLVKIWSRVLHRVPGSKLALQSRHLTDQTLQRTLVDMFAAQGIEGSRLSFRDWQQYATLLGDYGKVDVALDPFPFGGGATTCDALWMGVPVVTLPGETFASRHSCSYLTTVGLPELIAKSANDYIDIAVALAQDSDCLQRYRSTLRQRVESSPLCDGRLCAEALASLLRKMWSEKQR